MRAAKYAKDYLQDPQVSVFIKEFTSQRITVEGAVARPGIYPIRGDTTLVQAIALAGGQGQLPDLTEVMVFRLEAGQRRQLTYDLIKIRGGEIEVDEADELDLRVRGDGAQPGAPHPARTDLDETDRAVTDDGPERVHSPGGIRQAPRLLRPRHHRGADGPHVLIPVARDAR